MLNLYRASAGSGKTYRLTQDYIRLLFADRQPYAHRRQLAVTFTNKATEEMKLRIITELDRLARGDKSGYREELIEHFGLPADKVNARAHHLLKEILHDYSSFSINTIDRFFQQVLRSFTREIGLHGGYNIEIDTDEPLATAIDGLLFSLDQKENRLLLDWLMQFARERIENGKGWDIRYAIRSLAGEIFKERYKKKLPLVREKLHNREFLNGYRQKLHAITSRFEKELKLTGEEALALMAHHNLTPADFKGGSRSTLFTFERLAAGEVKEPSNTFLALAGNPDNWCTKTAPAKAQIETAYHAGLNILVEKTATLFGEAFVEYNTAKTIAQHLYALGILSDIDSRIRLDSEENNRLLLSDTTELLNQIVDGSDTPFVFEKTGVYIHHLMMDEFQDTSAMQWQNFKPLMDNSLASGNENLIVGDVKQSIYRWRNSDWRLLDRQLFDDFANGQIHEEYLNDNWRSCRNVIDFNNLFFDRASLFMQQLFNDDLPEHYQGDLDHRLNEAYKGLYQHYSPKAGEGHVEVRFVDNEEKQWKENSLAQLPAIIEQWQDKGFALRDMAVLVRRNSEATEVVEYLLQYKNSEQAREGYRYDVISNEALVIGNSLAVRFIIEALRYILHPDDKLLQTLVSYLYLVLHQGKAPREALATCFDNTESADTHMVHEELQRLINEGTNRSIFELSEELIWLFGLKNSDGEDVYLQAFQDLVHQYSIKESAGIASFLEWWEEKGAQKTIASPEAQDAIRVITVHKSKGLGFEAVVMPFADWSLDNNNRDIIWCEPAVAPFSELELTPVQYSSSLAKTIFAADYFEERMASFIDNLNVAYVAFTRAKQELILLAPQPKPNAKGEIKVSSLATLLHRCITDELPTENIPADAKETCRSFAPFWNNESLTLNMGNTAQQSAKKQKDLQVHYRYAQSIAPISPIAVKYKGTDYLDTDTSSRTMSINYGLLMHEVLHNIRHEGDEQRAIADMERTGRITASEKGEITAMFDRFWNIEGIRQFFIPGLRILNETPIFTPDNQTYVPDRVVFAEEHATIIDYKFGHEQPRYRKQVLNYKNLVEKMGYTATAYLCYVGEDRLEEVK
jgi:ATP-dependent exoDNAse (exonuclease V) beta subunit